MRDINELIRHREAETVRLQKEIERVQKELEALHLTAKLLGESGEALRPAAPVAAADATGYTTSTTRPSVVPATTPNTWASAKQFP